LPPDAPGNPLQPAYILHRRAYRNSSLLLECFTPAGGRFPAIARPSATGGHPEPFQPWWLRIVGRGEVRTISSHEAAEGRPLLQGERLYCGFYLNELLLRLLPRDDPHPLLFQRYAETLAALAEGIAADRLRRFEVTLLQELGYGAPMHLEAGDGSAVVAEAHYHYHLEQGPARSADPATDTVAGATLLALAGERPFTDDTRRREARDLMRRLLDHYLGGRPLKSRELFRQPGRG
jgi:DNA repair protein RecO (recombination protein O)